MFGKEWWRSKALWFNTAYVLLAVVSMILAYFGYEEFKPTPQVVQIAGFVLAVGNWALRRWFTVEPIN